MRWDWDCDEHTAMKLACSGDPGQWPRTVRPDNNNNNNNNNNNDTIRSFILKLQQHEGERLNRGLIHPTQIMGYVNSNIIM
jgi:hypothetical protein